jgi:hypothetical protein
MTIEELEEEFSSLSDGPYPKWWHKKGFYQVAITDCRRDDEEGTLWVSFFISKNCDYTLKEFNGAWMRQTEKTPHADIVYEKWYNDIGLKVNSGERFLHSFVKEKPAEIVKSNVVEIKGIPNKPVEIELLPEK